MKACEYTTYSIAAAFKSQYLVCFFIFAYMKSARPEHGKFPYPRRAFLLCLLQNQERVISSGVTSQWSVSPRSPFISFTP